MSIGLPPAFDLDKVARLVASAKPQPEREAITRLVSYRAFVKVATLSGKYESRALKETLAVNGVFSPTVNLFPSDS